MVQIIAHRGARSLAPENTLLAARLGLESGADLWETDVRLTCDAQPVLFHDDTLVRCTDVCNRFPDRSTYAVCDWTLQELQQLDAGSWFIKADPFGQIARGFVGKSKFKTIQHQKIPTLAQGLEFTRQSGWRVNLELKFDDAKFGMLGPEKRISDKPALFDIPGIQADFELPRKTLETIHQTGISPDQVVVSSFFHPWLDWFMAQEPAIEVQALMGDEQSGPFDFKDYRFPCYNVNADWIQQEQVLVLKQRGRRVNLFTLNDPEAVDKWCRLPVDGIFTDFPQRFARL